ncbi:CLL_HP2_G0040650.mRNA.1.CDS.1 [Saccharomyces cerevisiae]|nr:CLL_HP2_G0040650.mRNA.1.CDS.1 [Saccharomyces cerevisiae]CAI6637154.1 CLL_HP2_G0040650.mRNA.1.CDS.1 [Saccharomyces cerevisiae]
MFSSSSHNRAMLPPSLVQRNNATTSPTTDSVSENNGSHILISLFVMESPSSPHISSFQTAISHRLTPSDLLISAARTPRTKRDE